MSDFDTVLERLLTDPLFQATLAANPGVALAGYTLDDAERGLLSAQLVTGSGEQHAVETRITKSGVVGLLGPVSSAFGGAPGTAAFGGAPGTAALGAAPGTAAFGAAPGTGAFGRAGVDAFGSAPQSGGGGPTEAFGAASGQESVGAAPSPASDYDTRVDVDGDGSWDTHTVYERAGGGVDVHADMNNDGVVDFIGHDLDRDGLIDEAKFDQNFDGTFDTHMVDDDGDGWMDRSEPIPPQPDQSQSFGAAPQAS